jgi:predicted DNA-binding protein YlxM (UPF0122 family)
MANEENKIDRVTLELVLQEFADEQKITNQRIIELIKKSDELQEKLEFEIKINKPQSASINSDIKPFLLLLQNGLTNIKTVINNLLKSVIKNSSFRSFMNRMLSCFTR